MDDYSKLWLPFLAGLILGAALNMWLIMRVFFPTNDLPKPGEIQWYATWVTIGPGVALGILSFVLFQRKRLTFATLCAGLSIGALGAVAVCAAIVV